MERDFATLIRHIRYTKMDPKFFTQNVVPSGLLTHEEIIKVFGNHFVAADTGFRHVVRGDPTWKVAKYHQMPVKGAAIEAMHNRLFDKMADVPPTCKLANSQAVFGVSAPVSRTSFARAALRPVPFPTCLSTWEVRTSEPPRLTAANESSPLKCAPLGHPSAVASRTTPRRERAVRPVPALAQTGTRMSERSAAATPPQTTAVCRGTLWAPARSSRRTQWCLSECFSEVSWRRRRRPSSSFPQ